MKNRQRKRTIRRDVIARILALTPADRKGQEDDLIAAFPGLPGLIQASTVLLYVTAFAEEFNTQPMLEAALQAGKRVVCPRVNRERSELDLFQIDDLSRDFEAGVLNIPEPRRDCRLVEPSEVDWVLVPGVAFDSHRNRIGRGAGHYDRLLPRLRPDVARWALAFDEQWVDAIPAEQHDQPLTGIVSPSRRVDAKSV